MIEVNNLSKKYDSRGIAGLHSINFKLVAGEVMAIMGPNGGGKSTLLNILSGKLKNDSGEFTVDGNVALFPEVETPADKNVQKFLIEQVTLDIDDEKKIQLARDLADTFEFTFQLRQKLSELSSGQKQKILLAAKLINRPALFLMDEPFAHLDPFTRKDILKNLFQYIRDQKITLLWVTHDLEEAFRFSDTIGILNFGKLEQWDKPENILRSPRNLFVAQFIGYQNFLPVKKTAEGWETPWGVWKTDLLGHLNEAIMVIPDQGWITTEGLDAQITDLWPTRQGMEYRLSLADRQLVMLQDSQAEILEINTRVKLSPRWNSCFIIPL